MRLFVGAVFVLLGLACLVYVWSGAAALEPEPPLVPLGVLFIGLGVGIGLRSRAAMLAAYLSLGAALVVIAWAALTTYRTGAASLAENPLMHFRLLTLAVAAAAVIIFFMFARRAPLAATFGAIDVVPLAGLVVAIALAVVWFVGSDENRLRPCSLGNDSACDVIATRLIESAERAPAAAPTPWEQRAARILDARECSSPERWPCAKRLYATGSVAARAGRFDAAKERFLRACGMERGWCARAAQETSLPWTPTERQRLELK